MKAAKVSEPESQGLCSETGHCGTVGGCLIPVTTPVTTLTIDFALGFNERYLDRGLQLLTCRFKCDMVCGLFAELAQQLHAACAQVLVRIGPMRRTPYNGFQVPCSKRRI